MYETLKNNKEKEVLQEIVNKLEREYIEEYGGDESFELELQLKEAVNYCVREYQIMQKKIAMRMPALANKKESLDKAYESGYQIVEKKEKQTRQLYEKMTENFISFDNKEYETLIHESIPTFFENYDAKFAPQENAVEWTYPVLKSFNKEKGIDYAHQYLSCIKLEQLFLQKLPEEYVRKVLSVHRGDYKKAQINLCSVVLRNLLGSMLMGKDCFNQDMNIKEYEALMKKLKKMKKEEIEEELKSLLEKLVNEQFMGDRTLYAYLVMDVPAYAGLLEVAAH